MLNDEQGTAVGFPRDGARAVADKMSEAALAWIESLAPDQREHAVYPSPTHHADAEAERVRWYYTPTDHGGLPLGAQRPRQQQRALALLSTGLSTPGYVTAVTIIGIENVLDQLENWKAHWGRERGRDPNLYYLRIFGDPGSTDPWGWRFGGHHISLSYLIIGRELVSATPCFLGADPASSPLLGHATLRPLAASEDMARELLRSLSPNQVKEALLLPRAVSDIVSGNRPRVSDGDQMIHMQDLWRSRFADGRLADAVDRIDQVAERNSQFDERDHRVLAITDKPKGIAGRWLDAEQRALLRALVNTYVGRLPHTLRRLESDAVLEPDTLDTIHFAWAGSAEEGEPHYYRLQGRRLLAEYDNTQRNANHAHSVLRDLANDFGFDALRVHRDAYHAQTSGSAGSNG